MLSWLFAHPVGWFIVVLAVWCLFMGGTAVLSSLFKKKELTDENGDKADDGTDG